jgi:diguanylate cyclase (GGDEF)-like protein/PAS domain S-box-containing protein
MIAGHLPSILVNLQYVFAGVALQLAVQLLLHYKRERTPYSIWMGLWSLSLVLALALNIWVLQAPHDQLMTAFALRAVGASLALALLIPTVATLAGRPVPWPFFATVSAILALRCLLIPTTGLVLLHHTTTEGASLAGPLDGVLWDLVIAFIVGYAITTIRYWRKTVDKVVFSVGLFVTVATGIAGIALTGPASELLGGYWMIPLIVTLQYFATRRDADIEARERHLVERQDAVLRELADSYARNKLALRSGGLGWFDYSPVDGGMKISPEFLELVGMDERTPVAVVVESLVPLNPSDPAGLIASAMERGTASADLEHVRGDGRAMWLSLTALRVDEHDGRLRIVGVGRDITERKRSEELLHHRAFHDSLTGLPNRAALMAALAEAEARRSPVALLVLDLDQFKDINDTLGHVVGDQVIAAVAERLARSLPEGGFLARLGGDEFAALIPVTESWGDGECPEADALLRSLDAPIELDKIRFSVRGSLGVVRAPQDGGDPLTLLRRADAAMYRAKAQQRGTWSDFTGADEDATTRRFRLAADLPSAIEGPDFEVHYQPSVWISTGRVYALEALARWHHPDLGSVPPTEFVPLAESYGLGLALLQRVLRDALAECRAWRQAGIAEHVAINVSPLTLGAPTFLSIVEEALAHAGVPHEALVLELTEEVFADARRPLQDTLWTLRSRGVKVAIDDFGTGYSCLSNIGRLPVDTVKLDRSFVTGVDHDRAAQVVVRSTVDLARGLGLRVVAEGVGSSTAAAILGGYGCDLVQGYWVCPPLPASEIRSWLAGARLGNLTQPRGGNSDQPRGGNSDQPRAGDPVRPGAGDPDQPGTGNLDQDSDVALSRPPGGRSTAPSRGPYPVGTKSPDGTSQTR